MMRKKFIKTLFVTLIVGSILCGCTGSNSQSELNTDTEAVEDDAKQDDALLDVPQKTVVLIWQGTGSIFKGCSMISTCWGVVQKGM